MSDVTIIMISFHSFDMSLSFLEPHLIKLSTKGFLVLSKGWAPRLYISCPADFLSFLATSRVILSTWSFTISPMILSHFWRHYFIWLNFFKTWEEQVSTKFKNQRRFKFSGWAILMYIGNTSEYAQDKWAISKVQSLDSIFWSILIFPLVIW